MALHPAQPTHVGTTTRRQRREADQRVAGRRGDSTADQELPESSSGRRGTHAIRWGARTTVLAVLAAGTVAIPLIQQTDSSAATGEQTVDESILPSTVETLTGIPGTALAPPSSLQSSGAPALRGDTSSSRSESREVLAGCSGIVTEPGAANGQLSSTDLCVMWDGQTQLRADAAEALAEMNTLWASRFGSDMCLSSGYRNLAQQSSVKAARGSLAAAAGKSNHGFGLAVDFCTPLTTGAQWQWLQDNAGTFGWENPEWAQPGGAGPYERWHWEYTKVQTDGFYYGG